MSLDKLPLHWCHKPIIAVDYKTIDEKSGAGDVEFISIGKAQWNNDVVNLEVQ